ncbi:MAG: DUF2304 family protein [Candidatus Peribacteria bacterium]|nr:MAG: DUF2304 family protein [Candidatus Peribacteria bacterium]
MLNEFGEFFGIARGADLIVYCSIIILSYFFFEVINQVTKTNYNFTRLCSSDAIRTAEHDLLPDVLAKVPNDTQKYGFLIRAYNEETTIGSVIDDLIIHGYTKLIVCNDGSRDATQQIVEQKIQQYPKATIILLSHLINRGGGAANKTLFLFASKYFAKLGVTWWVTYDADGQMSLDDMPKFIKQAETDSYDVLLGSRFVDAGAFSNMPNIRRIILRGSKFVTLIFNKVWVTDPHNGYRMLRASTLGKIYIFSDGMTYASEIIEQIKLKDLRYREVGVHIVYTDYSMSKGQSSLNAFKILKDLIYKAFFYK